MRCAVVLTSYTASEGLFRLTGFESAGFDRCAISCSPADLADIGKVRSVSSRRRWSAIVGIAHAISKSGVLRQASIEGHLCQTATALAANTGGRYVSPFANRAQAMRANLLAKATTATLQWTRDAS